MAEDYLTLATRGNQAELARLEALARDLMDCVEALCLRVARLEAPGLGSLPEQPPMLRPGERPEDSARRELLRSCAGGPPCRCRSLRDDATPAARKDASGK